MGVTEPGALGQVVQALAVAERIDRKRSLRHVTDCAVDDGDTVDGVDELYDLQRDPYKMQNVIDQPQAAATLTRLKHELSRLLEETGPVKF